MNWDPIFKPNYKKQNKRVELGKAKKNQNPDSYRDKAAEHFGVHAFTLGNEKHVHFFVLTQRNEPKKRQGFRIFWGFCFSACSRNTTRRPPTGGLLRQYCLQQALAAGFKTITLTQNVLRPVEILILKFPLWRGLGGCFLNRQLGGKRRPDKIHLTPESLSRLGGRFNPNSPGNIRGKWHNTAI